MFGVVTRNAADLTWDEFDRGFYEIKDVTGRCGEPVDTATNMISCFGDSARGELNPELIPVSKTGDRATREQPYFDWGFICPTRERYRDELGSIIAQAVDRSPDVRLGDIGFPRDDYCHCDACQTAFAAATEDDWYAWRCSVITDFIAESREQIPGRFSVSVYPDPYPGHLERRSGVDLEAIASIADEIVVPIYDLHYGTTYWLEVLAKGFASRISIPLCVELYAVNVELDNLIKAANVAEEYADSVVFGYDAAMARGAIRRLIADDNPGSTYGMPSDET